MYFEQKVSSMAWTSCWAMGATIIKLGELGSQRIGTSALSWFQHYLEQHPHDFSFLVDQGIWKTRTQDNSYPGQLVPRTTRTQDNSYPGQLVPKTTRTQDNSYPGQLVPKTTRIQDNSYPCGMISYISYHSISYIISYHISYHISKLHVLGFALENKTQSSFFHEIWPRNLVVNQRL